MTTLTIRAKFFPLAFFLLLFPPRVEIDGGPAQKLKWGDNPLQVPAGAHTLKMYFPYLFIFRHTGKASLDVTLSEGQNRTIQYKAPTWLMFLPGSMKVLDQAA